MGYQIPDRNHLFTFEGTAFEGAEVTMKVNVPLSFSFEVLDKRGEDERVVTELICNEVLVSWNLEDKEGNPIPATTEGMMQMPGAFFKQMMELWHKGVAEIPSPLGETSSDINMSGADMMAMANASSNLG